MVDFVNRETELEVIRRVLASPRAEMIIIYGRRGVGKSELLVRALDGYRGLYYQATSEVVSQQLADLTSELQRTGLAPLLGQLASVSSFLEVLATIAQSVTPQSLPIVIDEFPYLADAEQGFESTIQRWWDRAGRSLPNLKIFLAGSHVSWMHEHTLSEHGPLQNRRTGQIEVVPLSYRHAAAFYAHLGAGDRIRAYAIWGGLPGYLRELQPELPLWDLVAQTLLRPESRLAVEPDWLRFTDLRADRLYTSVVRAVATGAQRPSEIAQAVGRDSAAEVIPPLNRLIEAGVIERLSSFTVRDRARPPTRYIIADPFLAFWYRFIDPRRGTIRRARDAATTAIAREIAAEIDDYIARNVFEAVCREWVWDAVTRGQLPPDLSIGEVGTWWGGRDEKQDEIDVVALSPRREGILYGECKWSAAPMDRRDLGGVRAAIAAAAHDIPPIDRPWRALFSRSGFHPDLVTEASDPENRIILVNVDDLYTG